jgi:hypothetical protein
MKGYGPHQRRESPATGNSGNDDGPHGDRIASLAGFRSGGRWERETTPLRLTTSDANSRDKKKDFPWSSPAKSLTVISAITARRKVLTK